MLTKSDLQSVLQCPRKLWLEHRRPDLIPHDDPTLFRRATDGNIVGAKAREQLGAGLIVPAGGSDKAASATEAQKTLRANPAVPAAEVPMLRGDLYARADALVPEADGFVLRETKASTFPLKPDKATPDQPEKHHLSDVAIQAWVADGSGLPVTRIELNLLNSQWRYPGGGDFAGLFRQLDVTAEATTLKAQVPQWTQQARAVLASDIPQVVTGKQCTEPYACPFKTHCLALDPPGPEHPITLLPDSAGKGLAKKLHASKGYVSILEPQPAELAGKQAALYRRIQAAHRSGRPILDPGADHFMRQLPYPRYFFDFEGIDLAVPRWMGVRPYEQIPFQWSCHIERAPGLFEHEEFLDLSGDDPSIACIKHMRKAIAPDDGGPLIVYYATYERSRIAELAIRHPQHRELSEGYLARLVDLHPIVKDHYYHPMMQGSFSIKKVLPCIAPDLQYGDLDEIQEGTAAQVAYLFAALDPQTSEARRTDLEQKLRAYCRQDTWAMVRIAYFLEHGSQREPTRPAELP
jgi:hypothetical protein